MKPFTKLKTNHLIKEFVQLELLNSYTKKINDIDRGSFYYKTSLPEDDMLSFIPKQHLLLQCRREIVVYLLYCCRTL